MNQPLSERFQELAAGYVMGTLDAEELQEFQGLSQDLHEEEQLTSELQSLLHQLPYSLAEQHPPALLGDRIFAQAQRRPQRWLLGITMISTLAAIALGIDNLRMRTQLAQLDSPALQIVTSPQVLQANWDGITQVIEDHIRAKQKGGQAVEIKAREQAELFEILKSQNLILPETPPNLSTTTIQLLGGAICTFDKTIGIRVMYETQQRQPISLYQLHRASTPNFPIALTDPVVIQNDTGPNLLMWGDEQFIFAIVADLSRKDLRGLTKDLSYLEIQS